MKKLLLILIILGAFLPYNAFSDNGICGDANGGSFYYKPNNDLCKTGIASEVEFKNGENSGSYTFSWSCNGTDGGTNASCSALAKEGKCGPANYKTFDSEPKDGLCEEGIPSKVEKIQETGEGGTFTYQRRWTCGYLSSCKAYESEEFVIFECGDANLKNFSSTPNNNLLCNELGKPVQFTEFKNEEGSGWKRNCEGIQGPGSSVEPPVISCKAFKDEIALNGECGDANGGNFSYTPTDKLCNSGTPSSVSGNGPWTWNCTGENGGSNASCQANLANFSISGKVLKTKTKQPLAGVKIELINSSGSVMNFLNTNSNGDYSFTNLISGEYKLKESVLPGYKATSDFDFGDPTITSINLIESLSNINFFQKQKRKRLNPYTPPCSDDDLICEENIWKIKDGTRCKSELIGNNCKIENEETNSGKIEEDDKEIELNSADDENKEKPETEEKPNNDNSETINKIQDIIKKHEENKILLKEIENYANMTGNTEILKESKELIVTGTPIIKRTKIIRQRYVETKLNENDFRLAGSNNSDLKYWLEVVPEEDKSRDKYIVLPSQGLVMPINSLNKDTSDYKNYINGKKFNHNKYLESGALEVPGTSTKSYGETGNKVIVGHSSYYKSAPGRYKTQFQKIIEIDNGEEIWVYEKQNSGEYKRYKYKVINSYETKNNDLSIQNPGRGKNLTLYTCTPIGGVKGRWIVKAKFIEENKKNLIEKVHFSNIRVNTKIKINNFIEKTSEEKLFIAFKRTDELLEKYSDNEKSKEYLNYFRLKIAQKLTK